MTDQPRIHVAKGVPLNWTTENFSEFMTDQGFQKVESIGQPRSKYGHWHFSASESTDGTTTWLYTVTDNRDEHTTRNIAIEYYMPQRRADDLGTTTKLGEPDRLTRPPGSTSAPPLTQQHTTYTPPTLPSQGTTRAARSTGRQPPKKPLFYFFN